MKFRILLYETRIICIITYDYIYMTIYIYIYHKIIMYY